MGTLWMEITTTISAVTFFEHEDEYNGHKIMLPHGQPWCIFHDYGSGDNIFSVIDDDDDSEADDDPMTPSFQGWKSVSGEDAEFTMSY